MISKISNNTDRVFCINKKLLLIFILVITIIYGVFLFNKLTQNKLSYKSEAKINADIVSTITQLMVMPLSSTYQYRYYDLNLSNSCLNRSLNLDNNYLQLIYPTSYDSEINKSTKIILTDKDLINGRICDTYEKIDDSKPAYINPLIYSNRPQEILHDKYHGDKMQFVVSCGNGTSASSTLKDISTSAFNDLISGASQQPKAAWLRFPSLTACKYNEPGEYNMGVALMFYNKYGFVNSLNGTSYKIRIIGRNESLNSYRYPYASFYAKGELITNNRESVKVRLYIDSLEPVMSCQMASENTYAFLSNTTKDNKFNTELFFSSHPGCKNIYEINNIDFSDKETRYNCQIEVTVGQNNSSRLLPKTLECQIGQTVDFGTMYYTDAE